MIRAWVPSFPSIAIFFGVFVVSPPGLAEEPTAKASSQDAKTQRKLEKVVRALEVQNYTSAIKVLRSTKDLPCPECSALLGRAYVGSGQFGAAVESYRRAQDLLPEKTKATGLLNDIGNALFHLAFVPSLDEYRRVKKQVESMPGVQVGSVGEFRRKVWDERRKVVSRRGGDHFPAGAGGEWG